MLALAPLALLALAFNNVAATGTLGTTAALVPTGRKKREIIEEQEEMRLLGQLLNSTDTSYDVRDRLVANHVHCNSDNSEKISCLQQLACKYEDHSTRGKLAPIERRIVAK